MVKRSWTEAELGPSPQGSATSQSPGNRNPNPPHAHGHGHAHAHTHTHPHPHPHSDHHTGVSSSLVASSIHGSSVQQNGTEPAMSAGTVPSISRKIKACVACRKQKVRCWMDESGPPCRRCAEKDLSCVLNKSLQTLINEKLQSNDVFTTDLETLHANIQTVLRTLSLPPMGPLQSSSKANAHTPNSIEHSDPNYLEDAAGPSCDNSPKISPEDDSKLPPVPIHSVYHLTKLSALRSPEASDETHAPDRLERDPEAVNDFISNGLISLDDAECLFRLYTDRLDHYIYGVGARYSTLSMLRRKSRILTAAILTVAAMHDPQSNSAYITCNREFRRLLTASLLDRRVDRDHLRALSLVSYWLHDSSWIVSGIAVRRAAEFNIASKYQELISENSEHAADFIRIWYTIYICDQHLSTLYGRQCVSREDTAISGWEGLLNSAVCTTGDKRLVSQVTILGIVRNIRELFGSDTNEPIPTVFLTHIKAFDRQLDQWVGKWSTCIPEYQEGFGTFPRKGALFHFHFSKLYLYSHVFRGLGKTPIPPLFLESAHGAINAATSTLNMILSDADVKAGLVGLPCYIQSMIGFACMFLTKLTIVHGEALIERNVVVDLISRLKLVYTSTHVGKWHLVHHMATGFDKILSMLRMPQMTGDFGSAHGNGGGVLPLNHTTIVDDPNGLGPMDMSLMNLDAGFLMDTGMGLGSADHLQLGGADYDFGGHN